MALFIFNGVGYFLLHLLFQTNHKEHFNSFLSCCYLLHYFLCTLTPSKRHQICLIFSLTVLMHLAIAMYRFGEIDNDLIVSGVMSIMFFDLGLETHQGRLSQMYKMILENRKLAKEKQKVVQEFPHPVLILPQKIKKSSPCYSNDQFEQKIKALNQKVQELDNIKVTLKEKNELGKICHRCTLLQHLARSQKMKHSHFEETKWDAVLQCEQFMKKNSFEQDWLNNENDEEQASNRNFNIKSLNIEWKEVPSVMHVFIDTTDIINLEKAKNKIEMQKIMFASASHEFRTPLNAIINSFDFIKTGLEEFLTIVERRTSENFLKSRVVEEPIEIITKFIKTGSISSVLLLSLVEDILNLSKIDNGTIIIKHDLFNIPELLHEVHSLFEFQCYNKGVDLKIEWEDALNFNEISTDRNRVRQILLNLVSNSQKFTFGGFIKIKAAFFKTLEGQDFLEFRVQDTGTGIKEENLDCLFKLFGIVEKNEDLNPDGCGLGLTISKKYVELLGGEIMVESVYGEGTEMIFTILAQEIKRIPSKKSIVKINSPVLSRNIMRSLSGSESRINEEYSSRSRVVKKPAISKFNTSKFSYAISFNLLAKILITFLLGFFVLIVILDCEGASRFFTIFFSLILLIQRKNLQS
ncbi:unnamed protein product [Moneuplotes crassus]|uniref:histidine kinase n=1 Tax=Euplotes crassus TaxID=5936 RepID=A0AAD2D2X0_EUPCR|nr:unnamed protein product [Moneuplotes crassus]